MAAFREKVTALCSLGLIYASPVDDQTWEKLLQAIRRRFPTVRQLSTRELSDWLSSSNRPHPVLLDVRSEREFAISHLKDAIRVSSIEEVKHHAHSIDTPLVAYCSVGYRSSALAEKLQKSGFTNVWNLEGSLFAWANEGRPVFRGEEKLSSPVVHPYSRKWGQLLALHLRRD